LTWEESCARMREILERVTEMPKEEVWVYLQLGGMGFRKRGGGTGRGQVLSKAEIISKKGGNGQV